MAEDKELTSAPSRRHGQPDDYLTPPFLVAAVGASTGGLDAVSRLIVDMPRAAQLSLVLAQHMSPRYPSLLAEILARRSALRVAFADDEQKVEVGHVYVIPPDKHMTVIDGHLRLAPRPEGAWAHLIDALFCSVAEYYRHKAVGIILSGALSDGSLGCHAIRAVGGITFAQSPAQAQIGSMPRAAIAAGVHQVMPAEEIGAELVRLAALPRFK